MASYTQGGAWAWHAEDELGVIRVGARADVVVWSSNLYALGADELLGERADLTIVNGAVVHDARREFAEEPPVEAAAAYATKGVPFSAHSTCSH
ncbi:amidohydrolase family protein [Paenarthrobacter sp. TYUT067]|uniref:amidohydrolase family protein n=1 Tax=Paenarthrobacter sp. TYUT067 TaxID=2926245 RepID=UPI0027E10270|nr:amidohydrolase family protein [Paenarthrobacter sp. TYUT067]